MEWNFNIALKLLSALNIQLQPKYRSDGIFKFNQCHLVVREAIESPAVKQSYLDRVRSLHHHYSKGQTAIITMFCTSVLNVTKHPTCLAYFQSNYRPLVHGKCKTVLQTHLK